MADATVKLRLVFSGHSQPYIRISVAPIGRQHLGNILRALGEQQPVEVRGFADQLPEIIAPFRRHLIVKDVGHRGTEDAVADAQFLGLSVPFARQVPVLGAGPLAGLVAPQVFPETLGKGPGITEITGARYRRAAPPRVEGMVSPFDFAILGHGAISDIWLRSRQP